MDKSPNSGLAVPAGSPAADAWHDMVARLQPDSGERPSAGLSCRWIRDGDRLISVWVPELSR